MEIYSVIEEKASLPRDFLGGNRCTNIGVETVFPSIKRYSAKLAREMNFVLFGIIFLITSYFVPIKLYYVIFGCIFLVFSLILRFFGKNKLTSEEEYKNT